MSPQFPDEASEIMKELKLVLGSEYDQFLAPTGGNKDLVQADLESSYDAAFESEPW